ncbi:hypothetical protein T439DRAFT_33967 [Meredithblackwellia eburnea MCA 4105]
MDELGEMCTRSFVEGLKGRMNTLGEVGRGMVEVALEVGRALDALGMDMREGEGEGEAWTGEEGRPYPLLRTDSLTPSHSASQALSRTSSTDSDDDSLNSHPVPLSPSTSTPLSPTLSSTFPSNQTPQIPIPVPSRITSNGAPSQPPPPPPPITLARSIPVAPRPLSSFVEGDILGGMIPKAPRNVMERLDDERDTSDDEFDDGQVAHSGTGVGVGGSGGYHSTYQPTTGGGGARLRKKAMSDTSSLNSGGRGRRNSFFGGLASLFRSPKKKRIERETSSDVGRRITRGGAGTSGEEWNTARTERNVRKAVSSAGLRSPGHVGGGGGGAGESSDEERRDVRRVVNDRFDTKGKGKGKIIGGRKAMSDLGRPSPSAAFPATVNTTTKEKEKRKTLKSPSAPVAVVGTTTAKKDKEPTKEEIYNSLLPPRPEPEGVRVRKHSAPATIPAPAPATATGTRSTTTAAPRPTSNAVHPPTHAANQTTTTTNLSRSNTTTTTGTGTGTMKKKKKRAVPAPIISPPTAEDLARSLPSAKRSIYDPPLPHSSASPSMPVHPNSVQPVLAGKEGEGEGHGEKEVRMVAPRSLEKNARKAREEDVMLGLSDWVSHPTGTGRVGVTNGAGAGAGGEGVGVGRKLSVKEREKRRSAIPDAVLAVGVVGIPSSAASKKVGETKVAPGGGGEGETSRRYAGAPHALSTATPPPPTSTNTPIVTPSTPVAVSHPSPNPATTPTHLAPSTSITRALSPDSATKRKSVRLDGGSTTIIEEGYVSPPGSVRSDNNAVPAKGILVHHSPTPTPSSAPVNGWRDRNGGGDSSDESSDDGGYRAARRKLAKETSALESLFGGKGKSKA